MELLHFKRLNIHGWRQFGRVGIRLHPRLTVITGANGSGKSTLLNIFAHHLGFQRSFVSVPVYEAGAFQYQPAIVTRWMGSNGHTQIRRPSDSKVGTLTYSDGSEVEINAPSVNHALYSLKMSERTNIVGTHIDSHRPISAYEGIQHIPADLTDASRIFSFYDHAMRTLYQGNGGQPLGRLKDSILAMDLFGEATERRPGNPALAGLLRGFIEVLRKILPPTLGFQDIETRHNEIVVKTETGEFMLDAASGGIAALIDIGWRLFMVSQINGRFVVTMDEPENHLHPSMQRTLLTRLTEAFPEAQFIVATHSPFIVSSVRDARVYVLRYPPGVAEIANPASLRKVYSERLDTVNRAASANEILREVLGVEVTAPEWVIADIHRVVDSYAQSNLTVSALKRLREQLAQLGYADHYSTALAELVRRHDQA